MLIVQAEVPFPKNLTYSFPKGHRTPQMLSSAKRFYHSKSRHAWPEMLFMLLVKPAFFPLVQVPANIVPQADKESMVKGRPCLCRDLMHHDCNGRTSILRDVSIVSRRLLEAAPSILRSYPCAPLCNDNHGSVSICTLNQPVLNVATMDILLNLRQRAVIERGACPSPKCHSNAHAPPETLSLLIAGFRTACGAPS